MPNARLLVFAATFLAAANVAAAEPTYVGTWATDAAQCKMPQERQGAPMIIRANGYDQHEAHCTFRSVKKTISGWNVTAECLVEGDKQKDAFRFRVVNGALIMGGGTSARKFVRCR